MTRSSLSIFSRPKTLIASTTILLSAFLLFTVQLVLGKIMLPYFGGSASVWNTSMMFYQVLLLAGYVYAHLIGKWLPTRGQVVAHWGLFALSLILLHFTITPDQVIEASTHPIRTQILLMTTLVGAPFFVLSATAPLIQKWYMEIDPQGRERIYLLYATSNLGSFLALLAYPFVIEPLLALHSQIAIWRGVQLGLFILFLVNGAFLLKARHAATKAHNDNNAKQKAQPIAPRHILLWVLLAFIPSSLSLGVTMKITSDIASMPMIWVIPLALYLLTFVLAFRDKPVISIDLAITSSLIFSLLFAALSININFDSDLTSMSIALLCFFTLAYTCHRLLYERRPDTAHLTAYYIYLSIGGALGGIANSLIAPLIFSDAYEFGLSIALALFTVLILTRQAPTAFSQKLLPGVIILTVLALCLSFYLTGYNPAWLLGLFLILAGVPFHDRFRSGFAALTVGLLVMTMVVPFLGAHIVHQERNYFGVKRVTDFHGLRTFSHGTTNHGVQILDEAHRLTPLTYYNPTGPAADIFHAMAKHTPHPKALVVGLGIGGLSCLSTPAFDLSYIEIDPSVIRIAEDKSMFTFISDCGPKETMILGDGRLELAKFPQGTFDLLFMDAFSSDSIPFHLITRDAVAMYLQKLKPDGLMAFHISNRYFNLAPELAAIAKDIGAHMTLRVQKPGKLPGTDYDYSGTIYVALSFDQSALDRLKAENPDWNAYQGTIPKPVWSDDYMNIVRSLGFGDTIKKQMELNVSQPSSEGK